MKINKILRQFLPTRQIVIRDCAVLKIRQETHQQMRQENVTRNFQLPPEAPHGCETLPLL